MHRSIGNIVEELAGEKKYVRVCVKDKNECVFVSKLKKQNLFCRLGQDDCE